MFNRRPKENHAACGAWRAGVPVQLDVADANLAAQPEKGLSGRQSAVYLVGPRQHVDRNSDLARPRIGTSSHHGRPAFVRNAVAPRRDRGMGNDYRIRRVACHARFALGRDGGRQRAGVEGRWEDVDECRQADPRCAGRLVRQPHRRRLTRKPGRSKSGVRPAPERRPGAVRVPKHRRRRHLGGDHRESPEGRLGKRHRRTSRESESPVRRYSRPARSSRSTAARRGCACRIYRSSL